MRILLFAFSVKKLLRFFVVLFLSLLFGGAHAALVDRGGGLIYDDVLNVTWLQDANYAKTSGASSDGRLTYDAARTWAADLTYGGCDDWRLAGNIGGAHPFHFGWRFASGDDGHESLPHSELSYMYYVNLGLIGYKTTFGTFAPTFGVHGDSIFGGEANVGPVQNLQGGEYLSYADLEPYPYDRPWTFNTNTGDHFLRLMGDRFFVWAVRDGDVASVPEPGSTALVLLGLGALGFSAGRRRQARP